MPAADLTRVMAYPVHPKSWDRPAGSIEYRITADWDDPDPINGGEHHAIDLGNFRPPAGQPGDPVRAPIACRVIARRHFDGALGSVMELAPGWELRLWHLSWLATTLDRWVDVPAGAITGRTGASGLGTGAHTHAELWHLGRRIDPADYFLGRRLLQLTTEDDMRLSGTFRRHVHNRMAQLADGATFRAGVVAGEDDGLAVFPKGTVLYPMVVVAGRAAGTEPDRAEWYGCIMYVSPAAAALAGSTASGRHFGYFHSSVLPRTSDLSAVRLTPVETFDQDTEAAYRAGQVRMRARAAARAESTVLSTSIEPMP